MDAYKTFRDIAISLAIAGGLGFAASSFLKNSRAGDFDTATPTHYDVVHKQKPPKTPSFNMLPYGSKPSIKQNTIKSNPYQTPAIATPNLNSAPKATPTVYPSDEHIIRFRVGKTHYSAYTVDSNVSKYLDKKAPEMNLTEWLNTPDSKPLKPQDLEEKVVILTFWATWCGPCRREMPEIEAIWQKFKDRSLVVIGVHPSSSPFDEVKEFIDKNKYSFPIAYDSKNQIIDAYRIRAYPQQVLINKGVVRHNVCVEQLLEEKVK